MCAVADRGASACIWGAFSSCVDICSIIHLNILHIQTYCASERERARAISQRARICGGCGCDGAGGVRIYYYAARRTCQTHADTNILKHISHLSRKTRFSAAAAILRHTAREPSGIPERERDSRVGWTNYICLGATAALCCRIYYRCSSPHQQPTTHKTLCCAHFVCVGVSDDVGCNHRKRAHKTAAAAAAAKA